MVRIGRVEGEGSMRPGRRGGTVVMMLMVIRDRQEGQPARVMVVMQWVLRGPRRSRVSSEQGHSAREEKWPSEEQLVLL